MFCPFRAALTLCALLLPAAAPASAQSTFRLRVLDAHERSPLPGASVALVGTVRGTTTDAGGLAVFPNVPDGAQTFHVTFVGYGAAQVTRTFPRPDSLVTVLLEEDEEDLDEVIVGATRSARTIGDTPTRVEVIGEEEIGEKINMDPSGITMVLSESPGIVVQGTSAVSANATFRIQGLDGRYTQLLRDGFPLYGGFAGGLSLLQVPPLDLAAVEVIKGPASTLYGGDAIAGIVNLVSKRPTAEPERLLLLNGTTAGGLDAAGYYARRGAQTGVTALVSGNVQRAYDAEGDRFTNLPATRRFTVHPTFFHYGRGELEAGLSATAEVREGGDVDAVQDGGPGYAERNTSERMSAHAGYTRPLADAVALRLRTSGTRFRRTINVPASRFGGRQSASYSEASVVAGRGAHSVVAGLDLRTDAFDQDRSGPLGYGYGALGVFGQDTWDLTTAVALESGLRVDRHSDFGTFMLPRAALLVRPAEGVAVRVGGGLGYKAPTVFLEAAEARAFAGVQPLDGGVRAERSAGANVDLNVRRVIGGRVAATFNQAFFVTRLTRALEPEEAGGTVRFQNADGETRTAGSETTARLALDDVALFLGYVYLDAHREVRGARTHVPVTAAHRTYTVLVWEQHGRFRVGAEAYYTGPQRLTNGTRVPGYWLAGVMGERRFGRASLFLNFENVLDARQSRTAPLVTGARATPAFAEVWGPTDGFIANGGVKLRL